MGAWCNYYKGQMLLMKQTEKETPEREGWTRGEEERGG